jgi:hypothetical protein
MVLWYAESVTNEPGIYGWGVILGVSQDNILWRPVAPSDYLKMDPLFDEAIARVVNTIRGRMTRGTLWNVKKKESTELKSWIRTALNRTQ